MARYNEILVGRYARGVQKLYGLKGEVPVASLSGELGIVHTVFNGAENRYLEAWNRFAFGGGVAAVAAINSTLRLRNPQNSNVVIVLEQATVMPGIADTVLLGMVQTAADLVVTATGINNRLDLRQGNQGPVGVISNSDATHPGSLIITMRGQIPANSGYQFINFEDQEITLQPGQAVDLWEATVNTAAGFNFMWRERFLEESERA